MWLIINGSAEKDVGLIKKNKAQQTKNKIENDYYDLLVLLSFISFERR